MSVLKIKIDFHQQHQDYVETLFYFACTICNNFKQRIRVGVSDRVINLEVESVYLGVVEVIYLPRE